MPFTFPGELRRKRGHESDIVLIPFEVVIPGYGTADGRSPPWRPSHG